MWESAIGTGVARLSGGIRHHLPIPLRFRLAWARAHRRIDYLRLPLAVVERQVLARVFQSRVGYSPDLDAPQTFNEKIQWRKLNDRRPLLPLVADKYRVRDYVRRLIGEEHLIPLLHVTAQPQRIPYASLQPPYIIKPNNGSGRLLIVRTRSDLDVRSAIRTMSDCMRESYGFAMLSWAYGRIPPMVVVERLLLDEAGRLPRDYKFHVFNGRMAYVHVDQDRELGMRSVTYDRNWQPIAMCQRGIPAGDPAPPPLNAERMIGLAETLASELDYARIDLYNLEGRIYFGEITIYPDAGFRAFEPADWDHVWGDLWTLPQLSSPHDSSQPSSRGMPVHRETRPPTRYVAAPTPG